MPVQDSKSFLVFIGQVSQLVNSSSHGQNLQQELSEHPVQFILDLIKDQTQNLDVRKMACMILKLKISSKEKCLEYKLDPNSVLGKLQALYMIDSSNNKQLCRLQTTIQLVLQKIFQVHFDDVKKMSLFQQIAEQLPNQSFCSQYKHLAFLLILVRSMYYLSINNEVLVGQMVLYLGQVMIKAQSLQRTCLLNQNQENNELKQKETRQQITQILIKSISIIKEIRQTVELNNQEEENAVAEFMTNSKQLRTHMFRILKLNFTPLASDKGNNGPQVIAIWTSDPKLNKLKAQTLSLWHQVWQYYAQPDLLQLLFTSVLMVQKNLIADQIENIITYCLMLLERSCTHRQYADVFFKMTQNLTLKLFQLISINESEYSLIEKDPEQFIQINDDFCKQQQLQTMKTRAGSLIANLTLAIDGYLTFVTQLALLAVRQLQVKQQKTQAQTKMWNSFIASWPCSQQQLIQTSVLILSSISDQISKRSDLTLAVHSHLNTMMPYFALQDPLSQKPLFVLRYMQIYSFFSFPSCLDHFLRSFTKQVVYQKQISKSFETLMRYYDRKNSLMQQYVRQIANSIMLLGDQLTPLLEQQIMKNNRVIRNFKQNVLQKLVIWFLYSYQKEQVLKINKLSTLIIRLLHDNMKQELTEDKNLKPFSSQILTTYFQEIYKNIQKKIDHPCEQAIVQIAISHVQYLYDIEEMSLKNCEQFLHMGKMITQRNNLGLNNCLILFNGLICPDIPINTRRSYRNFKYDRITFEMSLRILNYISYWFGIMHEQSQNTQYAQNIQNGSIFREQDLWEIFQLAQICLFQIQVDLDSNQINYQAHLNGNEDFSGKILDFGLNVADKCYSQTLKAKVISVVLQIVQLLPQKVQRYGFLSHMKFPSPSQFPAYECRKYVYCLTRIMKNYVTHFDSSTRIKILKVIIDLIYFLENEKINIKNYEQKMFISGDSVSLNASQKRNKIYSAFDFRINFETHDQFRQLIAKYPVKQELTFLDHQQAYQGKIRDLADRIIINQKPRKKLTVKRNL